MANKPKLLVTRRLPEAVEERIGLDYQACLNPKDEVYTPRRLAELSIGRDAILAAAGDNLGPGAIENLSQGIRIIATFSVGYEHIDLETAVSRGIVVTNTPDVLTEATADIAMLLLLAAARRAHEGEKMARAGKWTGWAPTQLMGAELSSKRLGIVGMGRIGQAVARRARAFGMEIHYYNRNRLAQENEDGAVYHARPEELLALSQFISLHCPVTPQTRHFLNSERISLLPDKAIVVNTARGALLDDEALIQALKSGQVAAAGLDVYDGEPKINPRYLELDNVFLLPHLGSATIETRNSMGFKALDNLDAFFGGKEPPDRVG
ncbi:MAG: D-glycerate dehydrogenase [Rhodospirillales bacterium]